MNQLNAKSIIISDPMEVEPDPLQGLMHITSMDVTGLGGLQKSIMTLPNKLYKKTCLKHLRHLKRYFTHLRHFLALLTTAASTC